LESLTQYTWHIQVTDGKDTTEKTLTFTTEPVAPIISNPSPADGERDVPMDLPQLQFTLKDYQGDTMEYTVQTSPNIGSDHKVGVHDGTYTVPVSGLTYGATYLWYVNVTDGTHWTRKIFSFETGYPSQFDPFEFGWQYRKPITIDHTQVLDDLTNFPVLVSTSDTDLSQKAQVDGGDILFMNDAGISTRVYHDLESYDASSGTLVTWVNIPSLSSNDDTVFYMYYGNPSCINQEYPEKTWDSNYELVYHMNEANLAKIIDSTSNKRNTTSRSASSPSSVNGKSGKAIHFASGNWYIFPCSDIFRGNSDYSVQLWFNADSMSALAYLMILNQYAAINPLILGWNTANNILRTAIRTDYSWSVPVQTTALSTNTWNSVSLTYSTTSGWNLYWNTSSTSNAATSSLDSVSSNNGLGGLWDGTSTFIGTIDEVRISNIVRSAAWIQTSYATMNDPSLFVHIGQEEPGP
jgi:hypothetical protein